MLALVSEPSFTRRLIEVRPTGLRRMVDRDEMDEKVIAVPTRNPPYGEIHTIDQVLPHVKRELEHFFSIYKELEGRVAITQGWGGPREARRATVDARERCLGKKRLSEPFGEAL